MRQDDPDKALSILLFCDDNPNHAAMILDHIEALATLSKHKIYLFNSLCHTGYEGLDLDEFDVVVLHYSLFVIDDDFLAPVFRRKIRDFQGLKIQFIQDDYRAVDALTAQVRYMGIDILYTLVPEAEHHRIWEGRLPGVKLITWIAGYIPDRLVNVPTRPLKERPIDVGYRGRAMPYWLGSLSYEKVWVGKGFLEHAGSYPLKCDISWREEDRIYGDAWDEFNANCRTMLGCGSGATIADFDGSAEKAVRAYLADHPDAGYQEVADQVLTPHEGNINLNVISPRQFEAIAARSALILFPADYSGILQPWVHYIPLEKDFSNMAAVAEKIQDIPFLEAMVQRAYEDVIASGKYSYDAFVRSFDQVVDQHRKLHHRAKASKRSYYWMRVFRAQRLRIGYYKAANQLGAGQPLKINIRIRNRSHIITFPCLGLQLGMLRGFRKVVRGVRRLRSLFSKSPGTLDTGVETSSLAPAQRKETTEHGSKPEDAPLAARLSIDHCGRATAIRTGATVRTDPPAAAAAPHSVHELAGSKHSLRRERT